MRRYWRADDELWFLSLVDPHEIAALTSRSRGRSPRSKVESNYGPQLQTGVTRRRAAVHAQVADPRLLTAHVFTYGLARNVKGVCFLENLTFCKIIMSSVFLSL